MNLYLTLNQMIKIISLHVKKNLKNFKRQENPNTSF